MYWHTAMSRNSIRSEGPTEERTVAFASVILGISLISFLWPRIDLTGNHLQLDPGRAVSLHEQVAAKQ